MKITLTREDVKTALHLYLDARMTNFRGFDQFEVHQSGQITVRVVDGEAEFTFGLGELNEKTMEASK